MLFLRSTFGALTPNAPQFLWPERFTVPTFVGLAVMVAGFGLLLASLARAVAGAGSGNPIPASCLLTAEFGGILALLVAGAVLAAVCAVGILIGIWRVGTGFDNPLLQVGAVLLLIPVEGTVVLLIASRREIERRSAARAATGEIGRQRRAMRAPRRTVLGQREKTARWLVRRPEGTLARGGRG